MKLDRQLVLFHGNGSPVHDPEPFKYKNNLSDAVGFKTGSGTAKCTLNDGVIRGREFAADRLLYSAEDEEHWASSKYNNEREVKNFDAPVRLTSSSPMVKSVENDSVFRMDKSVMEHELPKEVTCSQEGTDHIVKDICIDEGVRGEDKCLFNSCITKKKVNTEVSPKIDIDKEAVKKNSNVDLSSEDVAKRFDDERTASNLRTPNIWISLERWAVKNDCSAEGNLKEFTGTREILDLGTEKSQNKPSKQLITLGDFLSVPQLDTAEEETLQRPIQDAVTERTYRSEEKLLIIPSTFADELSCYGYKESITGLFPRDSADKLSNHVRQDDKATTLCDYDGSEEGNLANQEFSYNSKLETASVTHKFNHFTPPASAGCNSHQENPENFDGQNSSGRGSVDTQPVPVSSFGESSFSSAGPLSSQITYSGKIPYSGSVSLRSDSSAGSTRSFAFPILPSKWNGSPVRMAKADRRHLRKHRSWRRFVCCKF